MRRGGNELEEPLPIPVPAAALWLLPAQPSSLSVLIKWDRNTDLALLDDKSTGRWLLSRALLLQQPDWREGGRRRRRRRISLGLNVMKINTSILQTADRTRLENNKSGSFLRSCNFGSGSEPAQWFGGFLGGAGTMPGRQERQLGRQ